VFTMHRGSGFCALVGPYGGNCEHDTSGSWSLRAAAHPGVMEARCIARCHRCAGCQYVSYASATGRCLWFTECQLDDLRNWTTCAEAGTQWETVHVRVGNAQQPLPTPEPRTQFRLAIATLIYGTARCGLLGWCQSTHRLQSALQSVLRTQLVILQENASTPHEDCPDAVYLPIDPKLEELVHRCVGVTIHRLRKFHTSWNHRLVLKWQAFALTAYDLVLMADLDVDVMPIDRNDPARLAARWIERLPLLLQPRRRHRVDGVVTGAGLRALGAADRESPLNMGFLLLRPSRWLYADGLRMLEQCPCNRSHGWGLVGPPASLKVAPRYLSPEQNGSTSRRPQLNIRWRRPGVRDAMCFECATPVIRRTRAFRENTWAYVAGAEDQGFFYWMLFLRHELGVYSNPRNIEHKMHHYWGSVLGAKAWEGRIWTSGMASSPRLGQNLDYLSRIEPAPAAKRTVCAHNMAALRRAAEAHPDTRPGADIYHHTKAGNRVHVAIGLL
jgi:hypothetical protein